MPLKKKYNRNKNFILIYKNDDLGEKYAIVTKNNGNTFTVELLDGTVKQVSVQGKLCRGPRKTKILPKDYVIIEPIDNPITGKWIIIHKYTKKNSDQLKKEGVIKTSNSNSSSNENNKTMNFFKEKEELNQNIEDQDVIDFINEI